MVLFQGGGQPAARKCRIDIEGVFARIGKVECGHEQSLLLSDFRSHVQQRAARCARLDLIVIVGRLVISAIGEII